MTDADSRIRQRMMAARQAHMDEEVNTYSAIITRCLSEVEDVKHLLPLTKENFFEVVSQGFILCKLLQTCFPKKVAISSKDVTQSPKNQFEAAENCNTAIAAARTLGCRVVNVGSQDLIAKVPSMVLGLVWQIVKKIVFTTTQTKVEEEALKELSAKQILLMWFNCHVKHYDPNFSIRDFAEDIKSGKAYGMLLHRLKGHGDADPDGLLADTDPETKARAVLKAAAALGVPEIITVEAIVNGVSRPNTAFVGALFEKYPNMDYTPPKEETPEKKGPTDISPFAKEVIDQLNAKIQLLSEHKKALAQMVREKDLQVTKLLQEKEETEAKHRAEFAKVAEENASLTKRLQDIENEIKKDKELFGNDKQSANKQLENMIQIVSRHQSESSLVKRDMEDKVLSLSLSLDDAYKQIESIQPLLSIPKKSGWLMKQGHGLGKDWKRRYFVLYGVILSYYDSKQEARSSDRKPLGIIDISELSIRELPEDHFKRKFCCEIEAEQKKYYVSAKTQEKLKAWTDVLLQSQQMNAKWGDVDKFIQEIKKKAEQHRVSVRASIMRQSGGNNWIGAKPV